MMRCTRVVTPLLLTAWLLVLGACGDEAPTVPRAAPNRARPSLLLTDDAPPDPPGTLRTSLSPAASNQPISPYTFGNLPQATLVEVKASGLLDQNYSMASGWPDSLKGQFKRKWDAGGSFDWNAYCKANVTAYASQAGYIEFCRWDQYIPVTSVWLDTLVMKGDVYAKWAAGPPTWSSWCDGASNPPCYTYTGSFAITVTPAANKLTLAAMPSTISSGDTVTFTASAGGASFSVQEWIWQPDEPPGTSNTGSCTIGVTQCDAAINESGTMYVRATVGGYVEQAHTTVTVEPPDLSLSADRTEIQEGDTVVFTGHIIPESAPYEVVGWSWQPDGIITAAVTPMRGNVTAVLTDSTPPGDSTETDTLQTIDDSDLDVPDERPATNSCTHTELECTMTIYSSGTVTLTAYVAGTLRTRSVHVNVRYHCPPLIPMDAVSGPGEFAIETTANLIFPFFAPLGPRTVWVGPPYTWLEDAGTNSKGLAIAWYSPGYGSEPDGRTLVKPTSSLRFACRTRRDYDQGLGRYVYTGTVRYDFRANLQWFRLRIDG